MQWRHYFTGSAREIRCSKGQQGAYCPCIRFLASRSLRHQDYLEQRLWSCSSSASCISDRLRFVPRGLPNRAFPNEQDTIWWHTMHQKGNRQDGGRWRRWGWELNTFYDRKKGSYEARIYRYVTTAIQPPMKTNLFWILVSFLLQSRMGFLWCIAHLVGWYRFLSLLELYIDTRPLDYWFTYALCGWRACLTLHNLSIREHLFDIVQIGHDKMSWGSNFATLYASVWTSLAQMGGIRPYRNTLKIIRCWHMPRLLQEYLPSFGVRDIPHRVWCSCPAFGVEQSGCLAFLGQLLTRERRWQRTVSRPAPVARLTRGMPLFGWASALHGTEQVHTEGSHARATEQKEVVELASPCRGS